MFIDKIRENFIDCLENICNKSGIPKKTFCFILKLFYFTVPPFVLLCMLLLPRWLSILVLIYTIIVYCICIIFNKWFLSILDRNICGNITILDSYLKLFGLEINNKNRLHITYILGGLYILLLLGIYVYRFGFNFDVKPSIMKIYKLLPIKIF